MKKISKKKIQEVQNKILDRYDENGRDLPWRRTQDPYAIHVSEVMLQQTQVDRVIPYFYKWMESFPSYGDLAVAEKFDVLQHWSGLGFNSRALRLIACAQEITQDYGGKIPQNREKLLVLPGIGPYTSAAILAFAFNVEVPVIDTNIRRVLIFLFNLDEKITLRELESFAANIVPQGRSRDWHNALMDYGALHLTARKTKIKSLSKQSKFEGSDRQVRGWIVKGIVKQGSLCIDNVLTEFPQKDVEHILNGMIEEEIVKREGDKIYI